MCWWSGGVPGLTTDEYGYNAQKAVLEECPNINVVGEVVGNYIPAVAKSAVLQFLTSHPAGTSTPSCRSA